MTTSHQVRIGSLVFATPVFLAPMAGYTDLAFRQNVRPFGGIGLAYTEMISPSSLLRGRGKKRGTLLATCEADRPLAYQIYGADAAMLCAAAQWIEAHGGSLIDINMGCPQRKISTHGAGAGLLRDPRNAVAVAAQVVASVKVPVTAKLRLGWDHSQVVAHDLAQALEDEAGVAAITIHGRTRGQGYAGASDLQAIRRVVASVKRIPVIGNGDVTSPAAARRMFAETGCAAIMVGRGMLNNPWLIRDIWASLQGLPPVPPPGRGDWIAFMRGHLERMQELYGPQGGVLLFRKWIPIYVRKLLSGRPEMVRWLQITDPEEMKRAMESIALTPIAAPLTPS
jgi:tRNA-dihydrouridine synthase B